MQPFVKALFQHKMPSKIIFGVTQIHHILYIRNKW